MAVTDTTLPQQAAAGSVVSESAPSTPGELEELIGTADHTSLGRLYIGFSLLLLAVALAIRLVIGVDLATDNGIFGSYLAMIDPSATIALVFLGVMPALLGLAMVIVPLQVGSPAIAFPRAAALSLWAWLVGAGIFITSIALDGGVGGGDYDAAVLGNISLAVMMASLALGATCVATTVITHRPAGMGLARVPLFAWSMLVAASIWIVTVGSAVAHTVLGHVAADSAPGLAENFQIGLAWLMRGPAVYMLAIPVLGIAADAVARTTGRPLGNYGVFQGLIAAFGVLSFGAWAQGPESLNTVLWALWALAAVVPVLALLGGLAESLRHGPVKTSPALVGSFLALLALLAGTLVGVLMALDTAGKGTLFDFDPALLGQAQTIFVVTAAAGGLVAASALWSGQLWGAPSDSTSTGAAGLVFLGGAILALTLAAEVFVTAGGKEANAAIGIGEAVGALLMCVGILGALAASLGAARKSYENDVAADPGGMTLEWQVPWPAVASQRTAEIPPINSPYPLAGDPEDN